MKEECKSKRIEKRDEKAPSQFGKDMNYMKNLKTNDHKYHECMPNECETVFVFRKE
jgi:hypothetical protein